MKLAFDVDNVLADSMTCWCEKATAYLGLSVSKSSIKSHKIVGSVPVKPREIFRLQDEVWSEWEHLPPTEDDIAQKIAVLREYDFEIHIVTQRPLRSIRFVKKWLSKMKINYDGFHSLGPYRSKTEVPVDALVDDAPNEIRKFVKMGRMGFLYKQPWNRKIRISKAIFVNNIGEVLRHFKIPYQSQ